MRDTKKTILVLWGDNFDEAAAAIFVTELREAGLPVKIVSLTVHQPKGKRGLTIRPDLTLDQALPLVAKTGCIIIPSDSRWEDRYGHDPRLSDLCTRANSHQAKFVLSKRDRPGKLVLVPQDCNNILIYPDKSDLLPFVQDLVTRL